MNDCKSFKDLQSFSDFIFKISLADTFLQKQIISSGDCIMIENRSDFKDLDKVYSSFEWLDWCLMDKFNSSNNKIKVLGVDLALSNFGLARAIYDLTENKLEFQSVGLVSTSVDSRFVHKNSDLIERAKILATALSKEDEQADIMFVEIPTGSMSSEASKAFGIVLGILGSCVTVPLIEIRPVEMKKTVFGSKKVPNGKGGFKTELADKLEIISHFVKKYPRLNWLKQGDRPLNKNEHAADAVGLIEAGIILHSEVLVDLKSFSPKLKKKKQDRVTIKQIKELNYCEIALKKGSYANSVSLQVAGEIL